MSQAMAHVMQLGRDELFAALRELSYCIEACGASPELTHAVSLCGDISSAVGNQWNPSNPYAADRVRDALKVSR